MFLMKFAAIDIGSNAVRLLLSRVLEDSNQPLLRKESFVRIPLRLGEDVFTNQIISGDKSNKLIETINGFKNLMSAYNAIDYKACATSAMREAKNGRQLVAKIKQKTGVDVEIIDGFREAEIICSVGTEKNLSKNKPYLYVDVGGGSADLTLISSGNKIDSRSFNIGTIRILKGQVRKSHWRDMKIWLKEKTMDYSPLNAIGTGGNINKIFKLTRKNEGKPVSYKKIKEIYRFIKAFSLEDRIKLLQFRPDRADVIVPAMQIYLFIMKWANVKRIYVPQSGLADGMVNILYERHVQGATKGKLKILPVNSLKGLDRI